MGSIVLMEKFKALKARLKAWNLEVFDDLNREGKEIACKLEGLDRKAGEEGLNQEDILLRKHLQSEFWSVAKLNESPLYLKSRSRWVKDGTRKQNTWEMLLKLEKKP